MNRPILFLFSIMALAFAPLSWSAADEVPLREIQPKQWAKFNEIADVRADGEELQAKTAGNDPFMVSEEFAPVEAKEIKSIVVRMRVDVGSGKEGQVFWLTQSQPVDSDERHVIFPLQSDGQWHDYVIDTDALPSWQGKITSLRLDPVADAQDFAEFAVKSVSLVARADELASALPSEVETQLVLKDTPKADAGQNSLFTASGALLVNGQPTFALGLSGLPIVKDPFAEVEAAGFHYVLLNGMFEELLNTMEEHNLKVMFNPMQLYDASLAADVREKKLRDLLSRVESHASTIIGFFAIDEPAWNSTPIGLVQSGYEVLKSLSPRRPVFLNHAPRNTVEKLRSFNAFADITGCDIYPVPEGNGHSDLKNQTISAVGDYTDKMLASALPGQPVWMFLQAFGQGPGSQIPTWTQTRFMAYNVILHGAQGIIYWGLQELTWPNEMWPQLQRLGPELRALNDVLAAPWAGDFDEDSRKAGIELRHKRVAGEDYLFACNVTSAEKTLTWTMSTQPAKLHVLFEERVLEPSNGKFQDRFEPYAVHVYATKLVKRFEVAAAKRASSKFTPLLSSKACWIWDADLQQSDHSRPYFRRIIQVGELPPHAPVVITADNGYRFYCNGKLVGEDIDGSQGNWSTAERYDLAPFLRANAKNLLAIEGINETSWAGVFVEGDIGSLHLISDEEWRVTDKPTEGWNTSLNFEDSNWRLAKSFGSPPCVPWRSFLVPTK